MNEDRRSLLRHFGLLAGAALITPVTLASFEAKASDSRGEKSTESSHSGSDHETSTSSHDSNDSDHSENENDDGSDDNDVSDNEASDTSCVLKVSQKSCS